MKPGTKRTFYLISVFIQALFYMGAGVNHFLHADYYISIMPGYIPEQEILNMVAGIAEIILGFSMFFNRLRKWAATGICLMLIIFIPVHLEPVLHGGCSSPGNCIPWYAAFIRLCLHPLLLLWAWKSRKP